LSNKWKLARPPLLLIKAPPPVVLMILHVVKTVLTVARQAVRKRKNSEVSQR